MLSAKRVLRYIFFLCVFAQTMVCTLQPIMPESVMVLFVYTIHIGAIISFIILLMEFMSFGKKSNGSIYYLLVIAVIGILASLLINGNASYTVLVKSICYYEMLVFSIVACFSIKGDDHKLLDFICLMLIVQTIGYMYLYSLHLENNYKVFFLGQNKNQIGIQLLFAFTALMSAFLNTKEKKRVFYGVASIIIGVLIWMSRCRTAMLLLIIEIALGMTFAKSIIKRKAVTLVILIIPIIAMITLLAFPRLNLLSIFGGTGSILDGRELIYQDVFSTFESWFLVGNVGYFAFSNAHNGPLTLLASVGIVGYVIWFKIQYSQMEVLRENVLSGGNNGFAYFPLWGLYCCLFAATTEAMPYVHGQQISLMLATIVFMCRYYASGTSRRPTIKS